MEKPYNQNFSNHVRIVPLYHLAALPIFALNVLWSLYGVVRAFSSNSLYTRVNSIVWFLLAVALAILVVYARLFALAVQDRVIRLEMTLRLGQLLPPDLRPRIAEFTPDQFVALRFASDAELSELALRALDEKLTSRKAIKRMIKNWKPDFLRA